MEPPSEPRSSLPERGSVVIRDALVLTMDPSLGDLTPGDVQVRNGEIADVGRDLEAPGAEEIRGTGMIVMPGLVDTHRHLWTTIIRSLAGSEPELGYFALVSRLAPHFEPVDTYRSVRLSVADAISSGITTLHDWSHNIRDARYADASLVALEETGVRARFSYGWSWGTGENETLDLAGLRRLHGELQGSPRAQMLSLGVAGRGPGSATPDVIRREWASARKLGIPISVHIGIFTSNDIEELSNGGLLGPDVQLVHANRATPAAHRLIAASGSPLSISPWTEMLIGFGSPVVERLRAAGISVSLSVDTAAVSGAAEMFSVMRLVLALAHARARSERGLTPRDVLEMATIEGARGLGLADDVGSLTPGKRADLIMLRARDVDLAPVADPAAAAVLAAGPQNVDTVMVDGRILKRGGRLIALDPMMVVADASESLQAILERDATAGRQRADPRVSWRPQLATLGCCSA